MKRNILTFGLLFLSVVGFGQPFTNQVGIDEHLGDTLPLDLVFSNEQNKPTTLRQLIDRPTILAFVYFDCPGLCSPLQEGIADVVDKTDLVLGKDYRIITISFNFKDTPEKAIQKKANFISKMGPEKAKSWYYLTGDSLAVVKILNSVGYKIKITGVDYVHPSAIIAISPQGKITRYLYGTSFFPFDLKMAVIEAQKGISRPTVNRILQFCYNYEPEGKRYTLEITKLAGIFTLIVLAAFFAGLMIRNKRKSKNP